MCSFQTRDSEGDIMSMAGNERIACVMCARWCIACARCMNRLRGTAGALFANWSLIMPPPDDRPVKLVRKRLDALQLAAHLRSLAASAQHVELRVKGAVARYSDATTDSLEEVGRRLVAGELVAVQIRFFENDDWWTDTLMQAKDGFRLVRMREEV